MTLNSSSSLDALRIWLTHLSRPLLSRSFRSASATCLFAALAELYVFSNTSLLTNLSKLRSSRNRLWSSPLRDWSGLIVFASFTVVFFFVELFVKVSLLFN